jgi:hypothetical protein
MKLTTKILITTTAVLLILTVIIYFIQIIERQDYINLATPLIQKIEAYKSANGRLPSNVSEIDEEEKMGTGPYYRRQNDSCYKIVFTIGFDESFEYSSKSKKWHFKP